MQTLFDALLLFSPAGIANMVPVLVAPLPGLRNWKTPMDFGRTFRGKRIFGEHKTWRGLITGVVGGTLLGWAVYHVRDFGYSQTTFIALSASMSTGALLGDAVKSFFKRQLSIAPGKTWFPFDQLDYVVGGLLFMLPYGVPSAQIVLTIVALYFGLHLLAAYTGYQLRLKKDPI